MKSLQRWLPWIGLGMTFGISFALRDVIRRTVILPAAYLLFWGKLYYRAVPQVILWIALVAAIFILMVKLIPLRAIVSRPKKIKIGEVMGPVENLAGWVEKSPKGIYYKWLLANRLGRIARDILAMRSGDTLKRTLDPVEGSGWDPPEGIQKYLETGLNGSFADFPQPRFRWLRPAPTPLDVEVQKVIDHLETELEASHDGNRKGI